MTETVELYENDEPKKIGVWSWIMKKINNLKKEENEMIESPQSNPTEESEQTEKRVIFLNRFQNKGADIECITPRTLSSQQKVHEYIDEPAASPCIGENKIIEYYDFLQK